MKVKAIVLSGALAVSGCMQGPQSSDEVRSITGGGSGLASIFATQKTVTVSRSLASVTSSLRQGASKCLNRTVRSVSTTPGAYGPTTSVMDTKFTTKVKSNGASTEMVMHQEVLGRIFKQPAGISYVVDAKPVSGGTHLVLHGGKFGYGDINKAVTQWAQGGAIVCPKMPGTV